MHGDCDDAAAAAEDAVLPDELLEVCEVVLQLAMSFSYKIHVVFHALWPLSQLCIPLPYCFQQQYC